jgi:hypothetical protein
VVRHAQSRVDRKLVGRGEDVEQLGERRLLLQRVEVLGRGRVAAVDEYARLVSTVREGVDGKQGWEGYATWTPAKAEGAES